MQHITLALRNRKLVFTEYWKVVIFLSFRLGKVLSNIRLTISYNIKLNQIKPGTRNV